MGQVRPGSGACHFCPSRFQNPVTWPVLGAKGTGEYRARLGGVVCWSQQLGISFLAPQFADSGNKSNSPGTSSMAVLGENVFLEAQTRCFSPPNDFVGTNSMC